MMSASVENVLYSDICRLCSGRKPLLVSIFDGDPVDLLDALLSTLPSIEFVENDGKPENVCTDCCNKLIEYKNFVDECIKVDRLFNELLERPPSEVEHIDLDTEPYETEEIDSCNVAKKHNNYRDRGDKIDNYQSRILDFREVKEEVIEIEVEDETEYNKVCDTPTYEVQVYQTDKVNEYVCQNVSSNEVGQSSKALEEQLIFTGVSQYKSISNRDYQDNLTDEIEWRESCNETNSVEASQDESGRDQGHDSGNVIKQVVCEMDCDQEENLITLHVDRQSNSEIDDIVQEVIVGYTEEYDAQALIEEAQRLESEIPPGNAPTQNFQQNESAQQDNLSEHLDDCTEQLSNITEQINSQPPPPQKKSMFETKNPENKTVGKKKRKPPMITRPGTTKYFTVPFTSERSKRIREFREKTPYQFMCQFCGHTYRSRASLKHHISLHDSKLACPYCDKPFIRPSKLSHHLQVHTGIKPYRCHICSKNLNSHQYLNIHIKAHSLLSQYECPWCRNVFDNEKEYRLHCPLCGYGKSVIEEEHFQCPSVTRLT